MFFLFQENEHDFVNHVIDSNSSEDNRVLSRPMPILWCSNFLFLHTEHKTTISYIRQTHLVYLSVVYVVIAMLLMVLSNLKYSQSVLKKSELPKFNLFAVMIFCHCRHCFGRKQSKADRPEITVGYDGINWYQFTCWYCGITT